MFKRIISKIFDMEKIKDTFLFNYRDDTEPFGNFILKRGLWDLVYIPCSITGLYPFMYLMTFVFREHMYTILLVTTIIIIIQRYYMYQLFRKEIILVVFILMSFIIYFLGLSPIFWFIVYIFPIIYWGKNNIKLATIEVCVDVFCLLAVPYLFL